jgi:transposase
MHQSRHDGVSYRRVEVITGDRRRRSWSDEEKARIVVESADPDANISEIARRNGVSRGLLTVWRRQARISSAAIEPFARVRIETSASDEVGASIPMTAGADNRIEIQIGGAKILVPVGVDANTLGSVVAALRVGR